jgi:cysteine desulfurase
MNDVIVSAGSACKSGKDAVSDVLLAIKAPNPDCAIRFGLDRFTTEEQVIYAAKRISQIVKSIKEI